MMSLAIARDMELCNANIKSVRIGQKWLNGVATKEDHTSFAYFVVLLPLRPFHA